MSAAERILRRLQIERAALRAAERELSIVQPHPSIALMRAAYILAVGQSRVAENEVAA